MNEIIMEAQTKTDAPSRPSTSIFVAQPYSLKDSDILASRRERHRDLTQFSRRRRTDLTKVDELHRDCQAEVFLVIRREKKVYIYNSEDAADWPPTLKGMVSLTMSSAKTA